MSSCSIFWYYNYSSTFEKIRLLNQKDNGWLEDMSKEKSAAEKKQSVSDKATKENKENISQAKEEAKKLAQRIFGKLQKD